MLVYWKLIEKAEYSGTETEEIIYQWKEMQDLLKYFFFDIPDFPVKR